VGKSCQVWQGVIGLDFERGPGREGFDCGSGWVDGRGGEVVVRVPCEYCLGARWLAGFKGERGR